MSLPARDFEKVGVPFLVYPSGSWKQKAPMFKEMLGEIILGL